MWLNQLEHIFTRQTTTWLDKNFCFPLFDLEKLSNYADDNFIVRWNNCIEELIIDLKRSLEAIIKWLQNSGLKVNESKTEMCLFHRNNLRIITLNLNNIFFTSIPQINVLGIIFYSKLLRMEQISNTI